MIAKKNGITVDTRTAAPARKMIKCPQKTGINLNLQEDRQRDRRTLFIGIPAIAALVTVVVNFGVLQQYRRLDKDSYKLGIITDICQVGGFPKYKKVKPYVDTDGDGMPDEWEIANGLNPNDPSDANKDCTGDGYTNIEKYINGISTKEKVDWTDMKNNHDTLAEKGKLL